MLGRVPVRVHSGSLYPDSTDSVSEPHEGPDSHSHLCNAAENPPPPLASLSGQLTRQTHQIQTRVADPGSVASPPERDSPAGLPVKQWHCAGWPSRWRDGGGGFFWTELVLPPAWKGLGCSRWTRSSLEEPRLDLGEKRNFQKRGKDKLQLIQNFR